MAERAAPGRRHVSAATQRLSARQFFAKRAKTATKTTNTHNATPAAQYNDMQWQQTGLIQPELLPDGQVCVDMGEPILDGPKVPTTLAPTREGGAVVEAPLEVAGKQWAMTCVSMGNPHAVTYSAGGAPIKVRTGGGLFFSHREVGGGGPFEREELEAGGRGAAMVGA